MILDIDHVALNSHKFDDDIRKLLSYGYHIDFIEKQANNMQIKKELMKNFSSKHNLALLKNTDNLSIEILDHFSHNFKNPLIIPIFENLDDNNTEKITDKLISRIGSFEKLKIMDYPIYLLKTSKKNLFKFDKLILKTSDLKQSLSFWKNFGLRTSKLEKNIFILEFQSLFNKNYFKFFLIEESNAEKTLLDDIGFNCIAFISNSAEKEKEYLSEKNIKTTKIEEFVVNNKTLKIFFCHGPGGEIVEIISIKK